MRYEIFKEAGYKYIRKLECNEHLLLNIDTNTLEIFANNKNHASWGLIYKNTHLEFCRTYKYLQ